MKDKTIPTQQPLAGSKGSAIQKHCLVKIVGIRYHKPELLNHVDSLVGTILTLFPEPDNPRDANAVIAKIDGETLGYVWNGSLPDLGRVCDGKTCKVINVDCYKGDWSRPVLYADVEFVQGEYIPLESVSRYVFDKCRERSDRQISEQSAIISLLTNQVSHFFRSVLCVGTIKVGKIINVFTNERP